DGQVRLLIGNGDGSFAAATTAYQGALVHALATGDFNGDGFLDFAFASEGSSGGGTNGVQVVLGDGVGGFGPATGYTTTLTGARGDVWGADLNKDGILALGVANTDLAGTISVLVGKGDGSFGAPQSWTITPGASMRGVGDFDLDG